MAMILPKHLPARRDAGHAGAGAILAGMTRPSLLRPVAIGAVLILTVTGCGNAVEGIAEKAVERAIEDEVGGDASVEVDEDSVTIDTEQGSITAGSGSVPEDFPADIRLVEGEVTFAQRIDGADGTGWSVQIVTTGDAAAVADQVRADLADAGFSVDEQAELAAADGGATILAERSDLSAFVLVTSDASGTSVIYTVNEQAAR
jgi:hypothetical protein